MSRIAVIGAGAAGLMAALELDAAGHEVVVLEARDRVGGRIHTVAFDNGLWANAGAEWLNTSDAIAHELCRRYGLEVTPRYGMELGVVDGVLRTDLDEIGSITDELDRLAAGLTNTAEPWLDPLARRLDGGSLGEWVDRLPHVDADLRNRFATYVGGNDMAALEDLSLASAVLGQAGEIADRATRLTMGTAALPLAMANDFGYERIHLGAPVVTLHDDGGRVDVTTSDGAYTVDVVVLAIPLPALHRITIRPELHVPVVGQGGGGKLLVPFADRRRIETTTGLSADCDVQAVYHNASHQEHDGAVLAAYSRTVVDDARILAAIATWFPAIGEPVAPPIRAWWSEEPESGTTYSARRPGDLPALRRLQAPFGRVYLAGEHTQVWNGYVESALASGRRVALAIDHDHDHDHD